MKKRPPGHPDGRLEWSSYGLEIQGSGTSAIVLSTRLAIW